MAIGGAQILLIVLVIAILFLGPTRIPDLGKSLGKAIRGFKKGISEDELDVTDSVQREKIDEGSASAQQTASQKEKDKA